MKKTMKRTKWWLPALILLTAFQVISMAQVVFNDDGSLSTECLIFFGVYLAVEWVYFIAMSIARKRADPALEMIAFAHLHVLQIHEVLAADAGGQCQQC